jgi:hypothetical protein
MFRHFGASSSQSLFLMTHGCTELKSVAVIILVSACLRYDIGKNFTWRHIDVTDRQTDISSPVGIGTHKQAGELHIFWYATHNTSTELHIFWHATHNTSTPAIGIMLLYCCSLVTGSSRDCSVLWPRLCSDRFRVLTAETIKVFWDVTPCNFFCYSLWSTPSFFITKPTRFSNFTNFILPWNSTCFGQVFCPSSGVYSL